MSQNLHGKIVDDELYLIETDTNPPVDARCTPRGRSCRHCKIHELILLLCRRNVRPHVLIYRNDLVVDDVIQILQREGFSPADISRLSKEEDEVVFAFYEWYSYIRLSRIRRSILCRTLKQNFQCNGQLLN